MNDDYVNKMSDNYRNNNLTGDIVYENESNSKGDMADDSSESLNHDDFVLHYSGKSD